MTKSELYFKLFSQCDELERLQKAAPLTKENQRRLEYIKAVMADIEYEL